MTDQERREVCGRVLLEWREAEIEKARHAELLEELSVELGKLALKIGEGQMTKLTLEERALLDAERVSRVLTEWQQSKTRAEAAWKKKTEMGL